MEKPNFIPNLRVVGPTSERAYWIAETIKHLGKNQYGKPYDFNQINGQTLGWIPDDYAYMISVCKKSDNFARKWWGIIKKLKQKTNEHSNKQ